MAMQLFGFTITREKKKPEDQNLEQPNQKTFALPQNDDGAVTIQSGSYYGTYVDLDGVVRNEIELITRYREMSMQPELETAVDEIVNESIVMDDSGHSVDINLDDLEQPEQVKKKIIEEFKNVLRMLNFGNMGHDVFRRWYIDGRLFYHLVIDESSTAEGIKELRYIDPRRIRKIREIQKMKDPKSGMEVIKKQEEYYLYNERGVIGAHSNLGTKISADSIVNTNSGLMDAKRTMVLSYLHKAIKPLNQLRMIEDATVIYRLSRAPERRIFYVDVGNLPAVKAEQYLRDIMVKYRNKLVYDSTTGEIRDDRKHLSMLEDFWLPRREGCISLNTKIKLLDGRDIELGQVIVEHKMGKQNWVYSVSPEGKIVPGKISWAGVTRNDTDVIDIHLDNGEVVTATPDHKFILRNGEKIEAKDLMVGASLMPLYTRNAHITNNRNGVYLQAQDNESGKWKFVHRIVAESVYGLRKKNEVVHHIDFTRNNNPENLVYMDKDEHFKLHSRLGTNSWLNGNIEEHKKNLSISGKKFFTTVQGEKRKREISEFNKKSESVWKGLENGRKRIKEIRENDKMTLSPEEYISKWSPGLSKMKNLGTIAAKEAIEKDRKTLSSEEFSEKYKKRNVKNVLAYKNRISHVSLEKLSEIIERELLQDINTGNHRLVEAIREEYPSLNLKKIRNILRHQGYNSISDFIFRNINKNLVSKKRLVGLSDISNHKVTKIVMREDKIDVGTLTIDEHHEHHDYHNFALSCGIFIMNSKGTEITTLPGGMNLGELEDVKYFEKKLYKSLNVPISRLEPQQGFSLGRSTEVTRDELKFNKFVQRLRSKFSTLFDDILRVQLVLKRICTEEEWKEFKEDIWYDFNKDNNFSELKESELLGNRLSVLQLVDPYVGKYYSMEWVKRNVLQQDDEDIEEIGQQIANEAEVAQQQQQQQNSAMIAQGIDPSTGKPLQQDENGNPIDPTTGQPINPPAPLPYKFITVPNELEFIQ